MKKCLVTGGAGFIGSNLVDHLLENGYHVKVVDAECANSHDYYFWNSLAENHKFDINPNNLDRLVKLCEDVDYVFHLASDVSISFCIENPAETYLNNICSTTIVLEASRLAHVKKVVFSSTAAIYGLTDKVCVETDQPDPLKDVIFGSRYSPLRLYLNEGSSFSREISTSSAVPCAIYGTGAVGNFIGDDEMEFFNRVV